MANTAEDKAVEAKLVRQGTAIVQAMLNGEEVGFNNGLEYAANWIEYHLKGEPSTRVVEFGRNMVMSIRAAKKPWG